MYSISGTFRQFCFDRAVVTFGVALEAELDAIEGKNVQSKRQRLLDKWMDRPAQYRSPQATKIDHPTGDIEQTMTMTGDGV